MDSISDLMQQRSAPEHIIRASADRVALPSPVQVEISDSRVSPGNDRTK
jgi:hypothetical protein